MGHSRGRAVSGAAAAEAVEARRFVSRSTRGETANLRCDLRLVRDGVLDGEISEGRRGIRCASEA
jgi:hypothetical protein